MTLTNTPIVDQNFVMKYILDECEKYNLDIQCLCFDPANASKIMMDLSDQGYTVEEVINLKEYYKSQYVKLRNKLKDVRKELRIADNLIKEENEKPIRQVEDKKEERGIDNRDRQPKK